MSDKIGAKRERVTIQYGTESADAEGQPITTWANLVTTGDGAVWGRGEFLSGRELEAMQKINSEVSVRMTVNLRSDVTTKMRLNWKSPVSSVSEAYNIVAILPDEDRSDMRLILSKIK